METIYDVMKDRLQVTETTLMVTVLSGPRQGDKTVYAEDGSVLYGTAIEGFTVDKAKLNSLCMVGEIECFVQPVENDPSVLGIGCWSCEPSDYRFTVIHWLSCHCCR